MHNDAALAPSCSPYVPAGQLSQLALLFAPGRDPNVPGGHVVHASAFGSLLYVPAGHSEHAVPLMNVPGRHCVGHVADPGARTDGQTRHASQLAAAAVELNVPGKHGKQLALLTDPTCGLYVPAGHGVQTA